MNGRSVKPDAGSDDLGMADVSHAETEAIAKAIRQTRNDAQLTQTQLAGLLGTTQGNIARLESGRHLPSTRILQRIARVTGTHLRIAFDRSMITVNGLGQSPPSHAYEVQAMSDNSRPMSPFLRFSLNRRAFFGLATGSAAAASPRLHVAAQEALSTPEDVATPTAPTNGLQEDGSWLFTDDRGVIIHLPEPPKRVAATLMAAASLWDFGVRVPGVFDSGYSADDGAAWGNIDRELVMLIDAEEAGPDPEIVLSEGFDLLIGQFNPSIGATDPYFISEPAAKEMFEQVAPILAFSNATPYREGIERCAELAVALGADLDSAENVSARELADAKISEFSAVVAENDDLLTTFVAGTTEMIYVANPPRWPDLQLFADLGLNIVIPEVGDPDDWWAALSWEHANEYPADVIFTSTADINEQQPTYQQLPAVASGQVGHWNTYFFYSPQGITNSLDAILAVLQSAQPII